MWQPGNHPKFVDFETETIPWYEKVYNSIYPHDPSRHLPEPGQKPLHHLWQYRGLHLRPLILTESRKDQRSLPVL